jgi:hypothetical protein
MSTTTYSEREGFETGLRIAADLLYTARELKDVGQLSAADRGRGIAQSAFAACFLNRARESDAVFQGFVSGLSGYLAAWAAGHQLTSEDLRQTTWDDVHGGPETVYWGEVDPKLAPKTPHARDGAAAQADEAGHAPERAEPYSARMFTKGAALLRDVAEKLRQNEQASYPSADDRPAGVKQNTEPVEQMLETLAGDSDLRAGFTVALTALLGTVEGENAPFALEYLASLSPDDCLPAGTGKNCDDPAPTPPAAPAAASPNEDAAPSWRITVRDMLGPVQDAMGAVVTIENLDSAKNGGLVRHNLYGAQAILDAHASMLRTGDPDDYFGSCILPVLARLEGTRTMEHTGLATDLFLRPACETLEAISKILDDASVEPKAPPLPPTDEEIAAFMKGKAKAADMVAEAIDISERGSDEAGLEARWRGKGKPQHAFARKYLVELIERPELLDGFAAALSNTVECAGRGNDSPDTMRALSFEDYIGGPGTNWDLGDGSTVDDVDSSDAAPVFTTPQELGLDGILQRLDTYLEGMEHVHIGDEVHDVLHREAVGHYYEAREALDQHQPLGNVLNHMRALRDGLRVVADAMGELNPGWPLADACLRPLNMLFRREKEDVELTWDRVGIATEAGRFISRMTMVLRSDHDDVKPQDWDALHEAASVVMSVEDAMEDDVSLEHRLSLAISSASVIFEDQPPKHWREERTVRAEDVGKRLVSSEELVPA